MTTIEELRNEIDQIDEGIIQSFRKRLDIAMKVAEIKKKEGLDVYDKSREDAIHQKLRDLCIKNRLEYNVIKQIFSLYINYCKTVMYDA